MSMRNASLNVKVEEGSKREAQRVLDDVGMSMSTAINLYLRQIALHRAIPFEIRATPKPIGLASLSKEELDAELQKGKDDILAGRVRSRAELEAHFHATGRA